MSFVIEGDKEMIRRLVEIGQGSKIKEAIRSSGAELQSTAQRNASFTKGYSTGATKRSISLEVGNYEARVSPGTDYAPFLELGTRKMSAQPFMKPSIETVGPKFQDKLRKALGK